MDVATIKDVLAKQLHVAELGESLPYEPAALTNPPSLTIMTTGFERRQLEGPDVRTSRVVDPLGRRSWVWSFTVRVWVPLQSDAVEAQNTLDRLWPAIVRALEEDTSLGNRVTDSTLARGLNGVVSDQKGGNPLMVMEMDADVEFDEAA